MGSTICQTCFTKETDIEVLDAKENMLLSSSGELRSLSLLEITKYYAIIRA